MERRRVVDRLIGAGVAVLIMVLLVVALLLWMSRPASDDPPPGAGPVPSAGPTTPTGPTGPAVPVPDDLTEGEIWSDGVVIEAARAATTAGQLRDVRAVGSDVRTGPDGAVAGTLVVDATVPFAVVAAQMGDDGIVLERAGPQRATVHRTVELLGRAFDVEATGTVEVERGLIVVEPTSIDLGGPDFLADWLAAAVRELVTIEEPVEGLPEGLVLQDVVVLEDGFRATLSGEDVRLDLADVP